MCIWKRALNCWVDLVSTAPNCWCDSQWQGKFKDMLNTQSRKSMKSRTNSNNSFSSEINLFRIAISMSYWIMQRRKFDMSFTNYWEFSIICYVYSGSCCCCSCFQKSLAQHAHSTIQIVFTLSVIHLLSLSPMFYDFWLLHKICININNVNRRRQYIYSWHKKSEWLWQCTWSASTLYIDFYGMRCKL